MSTAPRLVWLSLFAVALALGATACSKKSTNPPPGGGFTFDTGTLNPTDTSAPITFATPGSYGYHCRFHETTMNGTITVDPGSSVATFNVSIVSSTAPGYSPALVTIMPGGTVTWTNNHNVDHTATSN
jgi:plastocyanin